ncbi:MAG: patatin-like phospholipase family protein [Akkermansiaceae bacterium]
MSDRSNREYSEDHQSTRGWLQRARDYVSGKIQDLSNGVSNGVTDLEMGVQRPARTRPPRIGLALGAGGAKSLAHIGVLKVLDEHKIPIHTVAGTSMGAYIGALWATGHTVEEMYELAAEMMDKGALKKLADPIMPPIKGIYYGNKVKAHLERSIGDVQFEDLDRKLLVISANLNNYERIVFRKGSVIDAVHASCAMPGIIAPVEIDGKRCVDGGVADPVPVGALRKFGGVDKIIAVSTTITLEEIDTLKDAEETAEREEQIGNSWWQDKLSVLNQKLNPAAPGNMLDNLSRSITIAQIRIAYDACKRADLAIQPVSRGSRWHEYSNFEKFIQLGEQTALDQLDEIKNLLEPLPENTTTKPQRTQNEINKQPMVGESLAERN